MRCFARSVRPPGEFAAWARFQGINSLATIVRPPGGKSTLFHPPGVETLATGGREDLILQRRLPTLAVALQHHRRGLDRDHFDS
jgi:hypothetical protein